MDPITHHRFLTYLEMWPYFHQPGTQKLDRENWLELDGAYEQMLKQLAAGELDSDGLQELRGLAKVLNRD